MQQAVKYGTAENLHQRAAANAAPKRKELFQFGGRSSHRVNVHRASTTVAAQAISRVAKPAWPRIGGQHARNATAHRPIAREKYRQPHQYVSINVSTKKGIVPRRARVKFVQ